MRADLYTAPVFFLLGAAMAWGGWTMDRLEIRQIHPASIPGLVPILLGAGLMIAAVILFVQARSKLARAGESAGEDGSRRDLLVAGGLCCFYALALVGTVPFPVATALFVTAFIIAFEARPADGARQMALVIAVGAVLGIAVAAAVSLLFRYAFLVRLP